MSELCHSVSMGRRSLTGESVVLTMIRWGGRVTLSVATLRGQEGYVGGGNRDHQGDAFADTHR